ncbi:DUF29 domain-containing protein [Chroococcus sp. FPU101]|uniref:DUF29 domain-containing protein n=1 Tax=Chroococcus sp. FPU101 TaxID=1974212 RepID=UPI001A8FC935|nr:DUF29 domain-containing protein [Chroococcus sp. FPU101]GFE70145.1 hypothetical protein CFPU101_27550 [Chroococcus sp. FPU101]
MNYQNLINLKKGETKQLYEQDYMLWIEATTNQLKSKDFDHLDLEHLIEEVESLGIEQRHKVDSYLRQLLLHLLIYQYWTQEKAYCAREWRGEITNFRNELETLFESRTLYNYFLEKIDLIYLKARRQAMIKTDLPTTTFPEKCPYTPEDIMNFNFFPE